MGEQREQDTDKLFSIKICPLFKYCNYLFCSCWNRFASYISLLCMSSMLLDYEKNVTGNKNIQLIYVVLVIAYCEIYINQVVSFCQKKINENVVN